MASMCVRAPAPLDAADGTPAEGSASVEAARARVLDTGAHRVGEPLNAVHGCGAAFVGGSGQFLLMHRDEVGVRTGDQFTCFAFQPCV